MRKELDLEIVDFKGNILKEAPEMPFAEYVLGFDGSGSSSGICILSLCGTYGFVCRASKIGCAERHHEQVLAAYKLAVQKLLVDFIARYDIKNAAYEEPFIGFSSSVKALYLMASVLNEIVVGYDFELRVIGVNNKRWKKNFVGSVKGNSETQKRAVRDKAISLVPALEALDKRFFDGTDAFGIATYLAGCVRVGRIDDMKSKGKARPFGYDVTLFGGEKPVEELAILKRAEEVIVMEISEKKCFNTLVFANLRRHNDALVLYFQTGVFGNIVLKYNGGALAKENAVLTAVVTRAIARKLFY
jgi:hypothetical protein